MSRLRTIRRGNTFEDVEITEAEEKELKKTEEEIRKLIQEIKEDTETPEEKESMERIEVMMGHLFKTDETSQEEPSSLDAKEAKPEDEETWSPRFDMKREDIVIPKGANINAPLPMEIENPYILPKEFDLKVSKDTIESIIEDLVPEDNKQKTRRSRELPKEDVLGSQVPNEEDTNE